MEKKIEKVRSTEAIKGAEMETSELEGPYGKIELTSSMSWGFGHDDPKVAEQILNELTERFRELKEGASKPLVLWEGPADSDRYWKQSRVKAWQERAEVGNPKERSDMEQLARFAFEHGAVGGGYDVSKA